jgi:trans-aconitate methyltransferase
MNQTYTIIFKGVCMVKRIFLIAAFTCASLSGMEDLQVTYVIEKDLQEFGNKHRISTDPIDFLEPHYGRAEQFFNDNKDIELYRYPVIAEVGTMSGRIAKDILLKQAPKSEIFGIVKPESPFKNLLKDEKESGGVRFQQLDIQNLKLGKHADLLLFLGQLPYVSDKPACIKKLAENIAPNGTFITTCVTPNNSALVKAFKDVKDDGPWKNDLDSIDIDKIWMPASREEIEKNLQDAGLTVKKVTLDESPVLFKGRNAFDNFLDAVTNGIKARTGNSQILSDAVQYHAYLEALRKKYLSYHPAREDGTIEYLLPENVFVAQKN